MKKCSPKSAHFTHDVIHVQIKTELNLCKIGQLCASKVHHSFLYIFLHFLNYAFRAVLRTANIALLLDNILFPTLDGGNVWEKHSALFAKLFEVVANEEQLKYKWKFTYREQQYHNLSSTTIITWMTSRWLNSFTMQMLKAGN